MKNGKLVDIECSFRKLSPHGNSFAVADGTQDTDPKTGKKRDKWYWLPISQVQVQDRELGDCGYGDTITVTMPEWLATREGLV